MRYLLAGKFPTTDSDPSLWKLASFFGDTAAEILSAILEIRGSGGGKKCVFVGQTVSSAAILFKLSEVRCRPRRLF